MAALEDAASASPTTGCATSRTSATGTPTGSTTVAGRRVDALCELNVVEQALNVCQTTVVQDAWQRGQEVVVHGWVYRLHNGLLKDLTMTVSRLDDAGAAYERALALVHSRYPASPA